MVSKALFSNNTDEWSTPQDFYDKLNAEFSFNLDPCATDENHKCDVYYTAKINGLSQNWGGAECFAIHHIATLLHGLRRLSERHGMTIRWLSC